MKIAKLLPNIENEIDELLKQDNIDLDSTLQETILYLLNYLLHIVKNLKVKAIIKLLIYLVKKL